MPNTIKGVEIDPVREKLVELLYEAKSRCQKSDCRGCDHYPLFGSCKEDMIADYLIANGITAATQIMQAPVYGDFIRCRADQISEAKELLLEQMVAAIRELAKKDDFFEVSELVNSQTAEKIKVAWKFCIPHMKA